MYPYTTEEADSLIINPSLGMYQEIHIPVGRLVLTVWKSILPWNWWLVFIFLINCHQIQIVCHCHFVNNVSSCILCERRQSPPWPLPVAIHRFRVSLGRHIFLNTCSTFAASDTGPWIPRLVGWSQFTWNRVLFASSVSNNGKVTPLV